MQLQKSLEQYQKSLFYIKIPKSVVAKHKIGVPWSMLKITKSYLQNKLNFYTFLHFRKSLKNPQIPEKGQKFQSRDKILKRALVSTLHVDCVTRSESKIENCMRWFQEQFCSVYEKWISCYRNKRYLTKKQIQWNRINFALQHTNKKGWSALSILRISTKSLIIFKKFLGETRIQSQILNACFPFRMRVSPIFLLKSKHQTRLQGFLVRNNLYCFHFCSCFWFKI